ncbi:PREDICTED: uncharacterized protein LOC109583922 isoform X2 [Amphimedon queenslandica]|uniref:Uncharacterized protein n=1 Tax=Amphimedon queenslandica TaxID=400682 RepID=A0AAN0JDD0_AMPQE|nr:PREDICTED: uncharacterized protein LOC109583922 isoform X2 [Amphimedon queenslandica]|eukprot:XP_019855004.1 PREDICTED: uncharacterized protein LOC109583922 isoform X2 [Amphimedon queenslandica]
MATRNTSPYDAFLNERPSSEELAQVDLKGFNVVLGYTEEAFSVLPNEEKIKLWLSNAPNATRRVLLGKLERDSAKKYEERLKEIYETSCVDQSREPSLEHGEIVPGMVDDEHYIAQATDKNNDGDSVLSPGVKFRGHVYRSGAKKCNTIIEHHEMMKDNFEEINVRFQTMIFEFQDSFSEAGIPVEKLLHFLTCFPNLKDQLEQLTEPRKIRDIIEVLKTECSIVNVKPFETLARSFNVEKASKVVRDYKKAVTEFRKSVCQYCHFDQEVQQKSDGRLKAAFVMSWDAKDILDVLRELKNCHIQVGRSITNRSIVTCECPVTDIVLLIAFILEKIKILKERGLKEFLVGKCTIWDSTVDEFLSVIMKEKNKEGFQKEIASLKEQLAARDRQIEEFQTLQGSQLSKITSLKKQLATRDRQIEELQTLQGSQSSELASLKEQLAAGEKQIEELLTIQGSQSSVSNNEMVTLQKMSKMKDREIEDLKAALKKALNQNSTNHEAMAGQIEWHSSEVQLTSPSEQQCSEVLAKLQDKHQQVYLRESSSSIAGLLIPPLLQRKTVRCLYIFSTPLTHDFICSLSSQVSNNNTIESLWLTNNTISDDGVITLAQSLKHNTHLRYLSLGYNPGITSACAQSLAELLTINRSLTVLYLSRTKIDTEGVLQLVKSLKSNDTLGKLILDEKHKQACSDQFISKMNKLDFSYKYADGTHF